MMWSAFCDNRRRHHLKWSSLQKARFGTVQCAAAAKHMQKSQKYQNPYQRSKDCDQDDGEDDKRLQ